MKLSEKSTLGSPSRLRNRLSILLAVAATSCSLKESKAESSKWDAVGETRRKVQWVIDGDTFKVCPDDDSCDRDEQIKIRIKGLECPESSQQACDRKPDDDCEKYIPIGKRAKKVAIGTLKNRFVTLIPTGEDGEFESGGYGRPLAYVEMDEDDVKGSDETDYGLIMIQRGLCYDFSHRYPHPREDEYREEQKRAGIFPLKVKKD
jgi:endonuclease YncB( thermonuclease family)